MSGLWQDLRFGLRMLAKHRGFTAVAVLTLAFGIGANTALFSLVNSVLFRSLPVVRPAELVDMSEAATKDRPASPGISWPAYVEYRDLTNTPFTGFAAYTDRLSVTLAQENAAGKPATAAVVTGNYFDLLGVRAARGRLIQLGDDVASDGNDVVVLSWQYWKQEFGGRAGAIGAMLRINGSPYAIVGVTPEDYFGIGLNNIPAIWLPMSAATRIEPVYRTQMQLPSNPYFHGVGRLKPSVNLAQARDQIQAIAAALGAGKTTTYNYPFAAANGRKFAAQPWEKPFPLLMPATAVAGKSWVKLSALLGAVLLLVLLIVAADLTSLLLARAECRQREMAVRRALGASRWQIARALVAEGLLLSGIGGVAGLFVAAWSVKLLVAVGPPQIGLPLATASSVLDWRVLLFTLALAVFAGVAFSLVPALRAAGADVLGALKSDSQNAVSGKPRAILRSGLIVFQIASSVLLLTGAGLLLRTLWNASRVELAFAPQRIFVGGLNLAKQGYEADAARVFLNNMTERLRAVPGVRAASYGTLPLGVVAGPQRAGDFSFTPVGPAYFSTLDVPLLRGREFTAQDRDGAPYVAVVNETMAREFWPGKDAIGQRMPHISPMLDATVEIVGVVPDVRKASLGAPARAALYVPLQQFYSAYPWPPATSLIVRTDGDARGIAKDVLAAIAGMDKKLVVLQPDTAAELLASNFDQQRFIAWLLVAFAALAIALAATGIYGLISYTTAARTREIGVRMALGAEPGDIQRLILRAGLALALAGIAVGIGASLMLSRFVAGMLYEVRAKDPLTLAVVPPLLLAIALLACYVPARRAAKLDPMVALRCD